MKRNEKVVPTVPPEDKMRRKPRMDQTRITELRAKLLNQGLFNHMAERLLRYCCMEDRGQNVFLSPMSVLMLLAIAADATAGQTQEEIIRVLGQSNAGKALGALQNTLCAEGVLSSASALCVRKDRAAGLKKEFRELLEQVYGGELFISEDMVQDVNAWVAEKTKGMIREAMPGTMENMMLCLINAVAFDDKWKIPYEDHEVRDGEFRNADGTVSTVKMMNGVEYDYIDQDRFRGFLKEYRNGFSFLGLLPKEEGSEALEEAVRLISFYRLLRRPLEKKVYTRMPEFTFNYTQELTPLFESMGISDLFRFGADFSPVLQSDRRLKVGSVLHKAFIDVNRQGTRAAAVTAMWVEEEGCAPEVEYEEVYLDRPFVFAIIHNRTGHPVFTGIVNRLESREA